MEAVYQGREEVLRVVSEPEVHWVKARELG
jgi:hypothetical protein